MKINQKRIIPIMGAIIGVLIVMNIGLLFPYTQPKPVIHDPLSFTGFVNIIVSDHGRLVSSIKQDAIVNLAYDFAACLLWSNGCGQQTGSGTNLLFPLTTYTTTATISGFYLAVSSLTGIALSTTVTQTSSACTNIQTANGLAPLEATVSHSAQANTPVVSLTQSWTNSGGTVTIASVCLVPAMGVFTPVQFATTVIAPASTMTCYAFENFAGQALANGQSITVTWTFNM